MSPIHEDVYLRSKKTLFLPFNCIMRLKRRKHLYVLETVGQVCCFPLVNVFKGAEKQCLGSKSSAQT